MNTIFNLFVVFEVFSLRLPVVDLKLIYPIQALLVLMLVAKYFAPNRSEISGINKYRKKVTWIQCLLFLSVCIPILLYGQPSRLTLNYTFVLFTWVLTAGLLVYNYRISLRSFFRTYIFSIFILLLLSIPLFFLTGDQRIDSFFGGGTNRLGLYSVVGLLVSFYIVSNKLDRQMSSIYKVGIGICAIALVLTFSRSALLALFVAIIEHTIRNKILRLSHIALGLVIAGGAVFYLNHMFETTLDDRYLKLMYRFGINELLGHPYFENLEAVSRAVHYENAIALISNSWSSIVFGLGLESYRSVDFLANSRGSDLTLHSMYLQYLMGGGAIALALLLSYVFLLYAWIRKLTNTQKNILLFMFIPSVVHAAFLPAIFSREILVYIPLLVVSTYSLGKTGQSHR